MIDPSAIEKTLQHLLPAIQAHKTKSSRPFVLGLSGLQGSGKSTWAAALTDTLTQKYNINTRTLSLDDLYHDHDRLIALRESNPENKLLRTRGQPGTHDEVLASQFFSDLCREGSDPVRWPAFDKSLFSGEGGRVPTSECEVVPRDPPLDVLIFEGWCLGFQPLSSAEVEAKWRAASESMGPAETQLTTNTLASHDLEHLLLINKNLGRYCETLMGSQHFDAFVHLTTDELVNVYHWRLDQERALRRTKGSGMSEKDVILFVQGYMPAYELYLERLTRKPFFPSGDEKVHLRVTLDRNRAVVSITTA